MGSKIYTKHKWALIFAGLISLFTLMLLLLSNLPQIKQSLNLCGQAEVYGYSTDYTQSPLLSYIPDKFDITEYQEMRETKDCFGPGSATYTFIKFKSDTLSALLENYLEMANQQFTGYRVCTPQNFYLPRTSEVNKFWDLENQKMYPICWSPNVNNNLKIGKSDSGYYYGQLIQTH